MNRTPAPEEGAHPTRTRFGRTRKKDAAPSWMIWVGVGLVAISVGSYLHSRVQVASSAPPSIAGLSAIRPPGTTRASATRSALGRLPSPTAVRVLVRWAPAVTAAAGAATSDLRGAGFKVLGDLSTSSGSTTAATAIEYPPGSASAAAELRTYVRGPVVLVQIAALPAGVIDLDLGRSFRGISR